MATMLERVRAISIHVPERKGGAADKPLTPYQRQSLVRAASGELRGTTGGWNAPYGPRINFSTVAVLEQRGLLAVDADRTRAVVTPAGRALLEPGS